MTCEKEAQECESQAKQVIGQGSAYIHCELEPFYISFDSIADCSTEFVLDSIFSTQWIRGCSMDTLNIDSIHADIEVFYLTDGEFVINPLNPNLEIAAWSPSVNGELVDLDQYPYYGAFTVNSAGRSFNLLLLNRYIGGCFHDELIWQVLE